MRRPAAAFAAALLLVIALAGCSRGGSGGTVYAPPGGAASDLTGIPFSTPGSGTALTLDLCLPDAGTAAPASSRLPVLLLLHGGGFFEGDKSSMSTLCHYGAEQGFAAVAIDYRLVPAAHFPAQVEDAAAAMRWIRSADGGARYGLDPDRVAAVGASAGGIIAESLGTGIGGADAVPAAVVALSGAADLTPSGRSLGTVSSSLQRALLGYLGCEDLDRCSDAVRASPVRHVSGRTAPMLLVASQHDIIPSEQSTAMAAAMRRAGRSATVRIVPGDDHGIALLRPSVLRATLRFLEERIGS